MQEVVSLPHSGGQWMASTITSTAPPRAKGCEGCEEVVNAYLDALRAGDPVGIIVARARVTRHFGAAHGEAEWPGRVGD